VFSFLIPHLNPFTLFTPKNDKQQKKLFFAPTKMNKTGRNKNSLLMTSPSAEPSVIPQMGKQQVLHSLQIWIRSQAGPRRGTCLSILTNLTLSPCLSERDRLETPPPPALSTFSTILLIKSFHSSFWSSRSAMIFPGKATFLSCPPKPVVDWASHVMQSPSLAHLSS